MKKYIVGLLVVIILLSLVVGGCSSDTVTVTETATVSAGTTADAATTTASGPIELISATLAYTEMPPPVNWDPWDNFYERWQDTIERESNGIVTFQRYPAETLLSAGDMADGIRKGVCDIGCIWSGISSSEFPLSSLTMLPGTFTDAITMSAVVQTLLEEGYFDEEYKDFKVLYVVGSSGDTMAIAGKNEQIKTLEDIKGKTVACFGEPETTMYKLLGAAPSSITMGEQTIALQRGTVDYGSQGLMGYFVFQAYQTAPYITFGGIDGGTSFLIIAMNKDKYNSLPDDIKAVIDHNSGMAWALFGGINWDVSSHLCLQYIEENLAANGYPAPYKLPAEEAVRWQEAMEPVIEQTLADLESKGYAARAFYKRMLELRDMYHDTYYTRYPTFGTP